MLAYFLAELPKSYVSSVAGIISPVILVVVFVLSIVKLGYVPVTVVAPVPVNDTVWSGAVLLNSVPTRVSPVPAV